MPECKSVFVSWRLAAVEFDELQCYLHHSSKGRSIAACWAFSVVLFRVSTTGSVARKLGILLVAEGGISNKERTLLTHLRNSLGISEADAEAIELELSTHLKLYTA